MKVISAELPQEGSEDKKQKYSRAELKEIASVIGPTGKLLARTVLKQEGLKLIIDNRDDDQSRSDGERIAEIAIAKTRANKAFRVKEARRISYTIVGQSAAGVVGS